ncbi:MAG: 23S rRNA (adenine(2503)-C(2))-methyltransferase RlmN [Leptospirales bacterium]|nr:23S rRNA (adenine(2503)-C(2))-methyltransferase RlmN [Leptospirales bacterium]
MQKALIKNISLPEADEWFASAGEKSYRGRQLFNWMYERNVASFHDMTNFSKTLRQRLDDEFILNSLVLEERLISKLDGAEKYLFKTIDGCYIESVLIKNNFGSDNERLSLCVSSQIGCRMGCLFCNTAKMGFVRNLETAEILEQLALVRRITGLKNNNIVFMGMGEPLLNYDNVIKAADIMNYSFGFHISVRKITISTCGIGNGIERFIDEGHQYNLAISLNDTEPEKRRINMPVERKYPFAGIISMLERKMPSSRNRLTVEYVMRKDNISRGDAKRLKKMFYHSKIKLNLIPLSPNGSEETPNDDEIKSFLNELAIMNVPVSVRASAGRDICGACGQLAGKKSEVSVI